MPGKGPRKGGLVLSANFVDWAKGQGLEKEISKLSAAVTQYKQQTSQNTLYASLDATKRKYLIQTYTQRLAQLQALSKDAAT